MDTTKQLEKVNLKVKKEHRLGNQQPSSFSMEKVQRLSRSSEYTQVSGSTGQPKHKCKDCGEIDLTKFGFRSDNSKPYNHCKSCRQKRNIDTQRKYANRPDVRAKKQACGRAYVAKNKKKLSKYKKQHRAINREQINAQKRKHYVDNKEELLKTMADYKKRNSGIVNAGCTKRYAAKMQRVPAWLSELDNLVIQEIYDLSRLITKSTGVKHHVDHIIPLQGVNVSGLHVPANLRIITDSENCSKGNKVEDIVCSTSKDVVNPFDLRGLKVI